MGQIYKSTVKIIPYVITWDGIVTIYHEKYRKMLKIEDHIEAYIQSLLLRKTFESICIDYRVFKEISYVERQRAIEDAVEKRLVACENQ